MVKTRIAIFAVITSILAFGITNFADAHLLPTNDPMLTEPLSNVDGSINVDCNGGGWTKIDGSPLGGDTDGDTLCNNWENFSGALVIDFKSPAGNSYYYKLTCIAGDCPNPDKRDLYVELDWMRDNETPNSHAPKAGVITHLITSFSQAPFLDKNNNGSLDAGDVMAGVNLHIQYGEDPTNADENKKGEINFHYNSLRTPGTSSLPGFNVVKKNYFGTNIERTCAVDDLPPGCPSTLSWANDPNNQIKNRLTAKRQAFHYGLIINQQYGNSFSGWAEQNANDFVISLYTFTPSMGTSDQQEGSIMHEIGHTLGLRHGGNQDYNCKPNYLSVMSFTFQFAANADSSRPLDYSQAKFNDLNENGGLNENSPPSVQGQPPDPADYFYPNSSNERKIFYSSTSGSKLEALVRNAINWNGGTAGQTNVSQNINNISSITGCSNSAFTNSLTGYDDWQNLNFDIFAANGGGSGQPSTDRWYTGDEAPDEENGPSEDEQGTGPIGMTMSTIDKQYDSEGNEIVPPTVTNESQEDKAVKKKLVDTLFFAKENAVLTHRFSTHMEITYDDVRNFYNLHLVDIDKKINNINDTYFKNGRSDKILLEKYLFDAIVANQKDDLDGVSKNLLTIKNIATDSINNDETKSEVLLVVNDKIKSFDIAKGGADDHRDIEHKQILDSVNKLDNSVTQLGDSVKQLDDSVTKLADRVGTDTDQGQSWYLIIGLIIAVIILAIALAFCCRMRK